MVTIFRVFGTIVLLCGFLLTIKFGFESISTLNGECASEFPVGACRALRVLLSSLLVFFSFYLVLLFANKLWGRNLFKVKCS